MIHVLNNLPNEYYVILHGLKYCLMVSRDNVLTIEVICEKLNHQYKKNKNKEKRETEKALGANNR